MCTISQGKNYLTKGGTKACMTYSNMRRVRETIEVVGPMTGNIIAPISRLTNVHISIITTGTRYGSMMMIEVLAKLSNHCHFSRQCVTNSVRVAM